jgi:RNA polymerase sigma-54 factor
MLQFRYEVRPRTEVTISPHVVVRSTLLELGYVELSECIEQELGENPALDLDIDSDDYEALPVGPPSHPIFPNSSGQYSSEGFPLDAVAESQTLQNELLWQLHATAPQSTHKIGEILIAAIDDDGYLTTDIFQVSEDLDVPLEKVQSALDYVQQLSPAGVGARSLRECLQLQLRDRHRAGEAIPDEVELIVQHFACCEDNIEKKLAEATNLAVSQVRDALEYIRRNLHPYPGRQFHTDAPQQSDNHQIYPDAIVYYDGEELSVKIPQSQAHTLRINHAYLRLERAMKRGKAVAEPASDLDADQIQAIREQIRSARRFIEMLQQRRITMQLVTEAIVRRQRAMFTRGIMALRPLTKKGIALEISLHESTVSRATRGKYVMMPDGALVPFSVFFEDALPTKALMARIIQQEDTDEPLTDKQLEKLLSGEGYQLARRTVTKYRKQMGIPSSRCRDDSFILSSSCPLG